jgi:hypothetical protein
MARPGKTRHRSSGAARAYHILRELGDEALAPLETPDREEVIAAA